MDIGIRAVLTGFEEAKRHFSELNREMDKTSDSARKLEESGGRGASEVKKLSETASEATSWIGRLGSVASSAGPLIASALGAGVAYASKELLAGIQNVRDIGEQIHNMSQRTGFAVETLGSLQLAATTNNLSLEALSGGFTQFNRKIIDATKGTGAASEAFERLGIDIRTQSGVLKTSEELFGEVANRFASMENGANKTALAMDLFGRSGAQMIPMLNEGAAGLERLREEARKAGIVLDEETAKAANELNSNLAVLKAYGQGFWMEVAAPIVRGLAEITRVMRDARREGAGLIGSIWAGITTNLEGVQGRQQNLIAQINKLQEQNAGLGGPDPMGSKAVMRGQNEARILALSRELQKLYHLEGVIKGEDVEGPQSITPAPEKSGRVAKAGRTSTAKGPSLMSELAAGARQWSELVEIGELSREDYISNLQAVSEAFSDNEEIRVHFAALAARELKKINDSVSKNALELLKDQEAREREYDKRGVEEEVKRAESKIRTRKNEIEADANLTEKEKLARLEALREEMQKEEYLAEYSREWRNALLRLDEDIAKQRVVVATETSKQIISILGREEFDTLAIFRGLVTGTKGVFRELLSGHIDLKEQASKIWKSLVDSVLDELARLATRAVLGPILDPMKDIFKDIGDWIKREVFDKLWDFIKAGFLRLLEWLRGLDFGSSLSGFSNAFGGGGGGMGGLLGSVARLFGGGGGSGGGGFPGLPGGLPDLGGLGGFAGVAAAYQMIATPIIDSVHDAIFGGPTSPTGYGLSTNPDGSFNFSGFGPNVYRDMQAQRTYYSGGEGGEYYVDFPAVQGIESLARLVDQGYYDPAKLRGLVGSREYGIGLGKYEGFLGFLRTLQGAEVKENPLRKELEARYAAELLAAQQNAVYGATGLDSYVSKPTVFVAGEAGMERVTISPVGGSAHSRGGKGNTVIQISGLSLMDTYSARRMAYELERMGGR